MSRSTSTQPAPSQPLHSARRSASQEPIPLHQRSMEVDEDDIHSQSESLESQRPVRSAQQSIHSRISRVDPELLSQTQMREQPMNLASPEITKARPKQRGARLMISNSLDFTGSSNSSSAVEESKQQFGHGRGSLSSAGPQIEEKKEQSSQLSTSHHEDKPSDEAKSKQRKQELAEQKIQEKRCKDLERFQINMGIASLYEQFNPQLQFYKQHQTKNERGQHLSRGVFGAKDDNSPNQGIGSGLAGQGSFSMKESIVKRQKTQLEKSPAPQSPDKIGSNSKPGNRKPMDRQDPASSIKKPKRVTQTGTFSSACKPSETSPALVVPQKRTPVDHLSQAAPKTTNEEAISNPEEEEVKSTETKNEAVKKPKIRVIKTKQRKLIVNINQTRYPIITKVAKYDFGFQMSNKDLFAGQLGMAAAVAAGQSFQQPMLSRDLEDDQFDIYWMDGAGQKHLDRFAQLKPFQRINHFPGMNILCRKNELGNLLNFMQTKMPGEFDFYPRTWVLPKDQRAFELYLKEAQEKQEEAKMINFHSKKNKVDDMIFIVKPEAACQGKGIYLIKELRDIEHQSQNSSFQGPSPPLHDQNHCVIQQYIESPLLIDKMKFDLRLYVLILGVDPPRIFLFKDGLARLATKPYSKPAENNMQNMQMHLTNYAINKNSSSFMQNFTAVADFIGSKRSLKFVLRYLKKMFKIDTAQLMKEIKDLTLKTILAAMPHLAHNYKNYHADDFENSLAFQILGIDIMLDENKKPFLLEINHAPSFATDSPLDEKIKGQVIYDTLNLLGMTQKRKKNYKQVTKMKMDLRRVSTKKLSFPPHLREQNRRDFDDLRNQYEFRNKGLFELIYPILDEITLDPIEDEMKKYQEILDFSRVTYYQKHNLKLPLSLEKLKQQYYALEKAGQAKKTRSSNASNLDGKKEPSKMSAQLTKVKQYYKNVKSRVFSEFNQNRDYKQSNNRLTTPIKLLNEGKEEEEAKDVVEAATPPPKQPPTQQVQHFQHFNRHNVKKQQPQFILASSEIIYNSIDQQLKMKEQSGRPPQIPLSQQRQRKLQTTGKKDEHRFQSTFSSKPMTTQLPKGYLLGDKPVDLSPKEEVLPETSGTALKDMTFLDLNKVINNERGENPDTRTIQEDSRDGNLGVLQSRNQLPNQPQYLSTRKTQNVQIKTPEQPIALSKELENSVFHRMMSFTDQAPRLPKTDLYISSATHTGIMENAPLAQRFMKLPGDKQITVANQINMAQPSTLSGISDLAGATPPKPITKPMAPQTTTNHHQNLQPRISQMTSQGVRPAPEKKGQRQVYIMAENKLKSLPSQKPKANSSLMWLQIQSMNMNQPRPQQKHKKQPSNPITSSEHVKQINSKALSAMTPPISNPVEEHKSEISHPNHPDIVAAINESKEGLQFQKIKLAGIIEASATQQPSQLDFHKTDDQSDFPFVSKKQSTFRTRPNSSTGLNKVSLPPKRDHEESKISTPQNKNDKVFLNLKADPALGPGTAPFGQMLHGAGVAQTPLQKRLKVAGYVPSSTFDDQPKQDLGAHFQEKRGSFFIQTKASGSSQTPYIVIQNFSTEDGEIGASLTEENRTLASSQIQQGRLKLRPKSSLFQQPPGNEGIDIVVSDQIKGTEALCDLRVTPSAQITQNSKIFLKIENQASGSNKAIVRSSMPDPGKGDGTQKAKKTIDFYLRNKSIVTIDPSAQDEDMGSTGQVAISSHQTQNQRSLQHLEKSKFQVEAEKKTARAEGGQQLLQFTNAILEQPRRAVEPSTFTRTGVTAIPIQNRSTIQDQKIDQSKIDQLLGQKSMDNRQLIIDSREATNLQLAAKHQELQALLWPQQTESVRTTLNTQMNDTRQPSFDVVQATSFRQFPQSSQQQQSHLRNLKKRSKAGLSHAPGVGGVQGVSMQTKAPLNSKKPAVGKAPRKEVLNTKQIQFQFTQKGLVRLPSMPANPPKQQQQ